MPQGLAISPIICLLALEHSGFIDVIQGGEIVQYADDGIVIANSLETAMEAEGILKGRCHSGIKINNEKSKITDLTKDSLKF